MKKRYWLLAALLISFTVRSNAQTNDLTFTAGYLQNLTTHWIVDKWEKTKNIRLTYTQNKLWIRYGAGVNFSCYRIAWFRYIDSEDNRLSEISPFLYLGRHYTGNRISLNPYLNLGYTFLFTNIEFYNGKKSAPYLSSGAAINYRISNTLLLGLNAAYHLTLTAPGFDTEGWIIHHDFVPAEGKVIHSLNLGLNLVLSLN